MPEQNGLTITQYMDKMNDVVMNEIATKEKRGLTIPAGYNVQNALTIAMYQIKGTVNRDKQPVLSACTADSIKQALVEMVTKGLDPNKNHCYWIAYGNALSCTESYFGVKYRAKRADPNIKDIYSCVVYEGDTLEYEIRYGTKVITKHIQSPENIDLSKIKGAYCTILYRDGNQVSEYMTMAQIKNSWARSQTKGESDAHKLAPEQMCMRTVTKRLCKSVLNTETNDTLLTDEEDMEMNADANEATEPIDITPVEECAVVVEEVKEIKEQKEVKEPEPKKEKKQMDLLDVPEL